MAGLHAWDVHVERSTSSFKGQVPQIITDMVGSGKLKNYLSSQLMYCYKVQVGSVPNSVL